VAGLLLHGPAEGGLDRVFAPRSVVNVQSPVACVVDPLNLAASVSVPVREALRIAAGRRVILAPEAAGTDEVAGLVRRVAQLPRGGNFAVVVVPAEAFSPRLIGVPVKARILLEELHDVLLVPNAAVRREDGRLFAMVRRAPDREEAVDLVLGATDGKRTVVKSGLVEGDEVVPPAETK
jgi:hypothetical protein